MEAVRYPFGALRNFAPIPYPALSWAPRTRDSATREAGVQPTQRSTVPAIRLTHSSSAHAFELFLAVLRNGLRDAGFVDRDVPISGQVTLVHNTQERISHEA